MDFWRIVRLMFFFVFFDVDYGANCLIFGFGPIGLQDSIWRTLLNEKKKKMEIYFYLMRWRLVREVQEIFIYFYFLCTPNTIYFIGRGQNFHPLLGDNFFFSFQFFFLNTFYFLEHIW